MTATTDTTHDNLLKLVRYASKHADVATTKRDAAIREAHRAGASLRELADASGISHMSIKRIIDRSS
ncbi:MAG: hypothetical protein ACT4PX_12240 [Actinomycetota bacterium]